MTAITTTNRLLTIARNIGDVVAAGTATAGAATTITDTANLIHATADQLKGYRVYVHTGTNSGKERVITAFDQTTYKITFATMTVACDTTTQYVIFRKHHYEDYNKALTLAEDAAAEAIAQDRHDYFIPLLDETLVVNDLLMGTGGMERWTATTYPDGWTADANSTISEENTIYDKGTSSAKMVSDGTNEGYLSWSLYQYLKYAGKQFDFIAKILTATASRARIRLTDGTTTTNSDYHTGASGWEEIEIENFELAAEATLTTPIASLRIEAGTAVTAYFDDVRLLSHSDIYIYTLPTVPYEFYTIAEIWQESSTEGDYDFLIPNRFWKIQGGYSTNYLVFDTNSFPLTKNRHLRILGQTTASVTREAKDSYIIAYATYMMCMMESNSPEMVLKSQIWRDEVGRLWRVMEYERQQLLQKWGTHTRALPNSAIVKYR